MIFVLQNSTGFWWNSTVISSNSSGFWSNSTGFYSNSTGFWCNSTGFWWNSTGFWWNSTGFVSNSCNYFGFFSSLNSALSLLGIWNKTQINYFAGMSFFAPAAEAAVVQSN